MGSSKDHGSAHRGGSFAESLPALKQRGCSVLVVGAVPADVHRGACERLLGDDSEEPRRRLIVRTGADETTNGRVAADPHDSGATRMIEHRIDARASAAVSTTGDGPNDDSKSPEPETVSSPGATTASDADDTIVEGELAGLRDEVSAAIEGIETTAGTLSPAELRVCLDSLLTIVNATDHGTVARLLRPVFAAVRDVRGMVHAHLPVARDMEIVDELRPLFDAVIELRVEVGRPQQRWHLRDGPSSRWLPLQSTTTSGRGGTDE